MTERDAFEARFHDAVRGYAARVSSDLDPVGLARTIAAAEPRRRGLDGVLASRRLTVSSLAWMLLLLAALLTVTMSAAIVGSVSRPLGALVGLPGAIVSGLALSAYGRDQEHEADAFGARLASEAGYRPRALAEFLARLEREDALHPGGPRPLSFVASHPRTPDRIRRVEALAGEGARGRGFGDGPRSEPRREGRADAEGAARGDPARARAAG